MFLRLSTKFISTPKIFRIFEEPIRSEIFSISRLEAHAESLARAQTVTTEPRRGKRITPRIAENHQVLEECYKQVIQEIENSRAITPAAEWLVDNFHIVRALLKEIHDYLPPKFYNELPKLADGHLKGYPRIYGIAWAFVAHTDSRFDAELLKHFLGAYQKVQPLTIGELWAVSITVRLVLIENLRRLAARIVGSQMARKDADLIADEILGLSETNTRSAKHIIRSLEKKHFTGAFAVQLLQRLRFQEAAVDPLLEWLERRFQRDNLIADDVVSNEHSRQTATNATVRNIITSARLISVFNWQDFFEEVSPVDEILSEHPNYRLMDFTSRDRYRHGLEELARYSKLSEHEVARRVIAKVTALKDVPSNRLTDPGYYLISDGRTEFEVELNYRATFRGKLNRWITGGNTLIYLGAIPIFSILILALVAISCSADYAWYKNGAFIFLFTLGLFPASEIGIALVNRMIVALLGPKYLPRLSLKEGVPLEMATFVVVPTMLALTSKIGEQLEQLEAHYLSNPNGHVYFALLTDWLDSNVEISNQDKHLLNIAAEKLAALNSKYTLGPTDEDRFYIFHRKRLFNAQEGKWLGWERKRGKLHEFNRLLQGHRDTTHIPIDSRPVKVPAGIRYVITLDADTKLPIGSVIKLVGTMAHPLNRAYYDEQKGRVTEGYGILQPRITAALPSTEDSTIFQRISAGRSGVDPYASAVSDVYQDLFGEGSYTGKGIYDLAAFEAALKDRVPENSLLSHDLFEGNFARCGFVSDIEFFEDFPGHSGVAALRAHRWTRGDWQLLPWIFGTRGKDIPIIGLWKMFDNLRRSLVAPTTFLMMVIPLVLPDFGVVPWIALALISFLVPAILTLATEFFPKPPSVTIIQHLKFILTDFVLGCGRAFFYLTVLPYHAWMSTDAIVRTLYRLFVSHRHMLEWTTAAQAKSSASLNSKSFWIGMRGGLLLVTVSAAAVALQNPSGVPYALGLVLIWIASPVVAKFCSSPPLRKPMAPVNPEDIRLLNLAARRIWRFFATFVTPEDNFLPPDNFQEGPVPVVAHRSSPTNFGLYLLSALAAHDFGWIGLTEMTERLNATLKSLLKLPKHEGHFFNWYETTEGRPLDPKYISSVDNGNLAGHLLAVAQGCIEKLDETISNAGFANVAKDSLGLLQDKLAKLLQLNPQLAGAAKAVTEHLENLFSILLNPDPVIGSQLNHWKLLREKSRLLLDAAKVFSSEYPEPKGKEVLAWGRAVCDDIESSAQDFISLMSWTDFSQSIQPENFSGHHQVLLKQIKLALKQPVSLSEIELHCKRIIQDVLELRRSIKSSGLPQGAFSFIDSLLDSLEGSVVTSKILTQKLVEAHQLCHQLFRDMDFGLLYDPVRKLFSIGLRVHENELDPSYYDLLASEARLTSFIAIAKGDVPVDHWFSLGRTLTPVENGAALVSWSGSMFEYLMPSLVMYTPPGSLLEQTCQLVIRRQISYATAKGVAWGISESAYNKRDLDLTYQYSNFGIPDLGLKRGLGADLVIAPYSSFLAAMFNSPEAASNLRRLEQQGACGPYGFYEAVDFTESRLKEGRSFAIVRAYMAHHQGMSLVALANVFRNGVMRRRFHAEPLIQATELLLQERVPRNVRMIKPNVESFQLGIVREISEDVSRKYHSVNRPTPTTELLSNGHYTVMLTSAGSGFSRFRNLALTRWREDVTKDNWGSYFYIKDLANDKIWSATYQPTCVPADGYEVDFTEARARFTRDDDGITSKLEVFVSPEDHAEIRRVTLTNHSVFTREIEVTSYSEVVMNTQAADVAHPAFSNLFVQTEYLSEINALFATRRPRSNAETPLWMAHVLLPDAHAIGATEYETNRANFVGRGQSIREPKAIFKDHHLSNSTGSVLDPILSLRVKIRLEPGATSNLVYSTMVADTREDLINLAEKFRDPATFERASNNAWTQAQVKMHYLNIEPSETHQFQRLGSRLIFSDSSLRPSGEILKRNKKDLTALWAHGISGDHPIILLRIDDIEDRGIARLLLKAQEYFATKYFMVDLVIINEKTNSYSQELQNLLEAMVHSSTTSAQSPLPQARGKIFVLRADLLTKEDLDLLYSEARVALSSRLGNLAEQVKRARTLVRDIPRGKPTELSSEDLDSTSLKVPHLEFFNGLGGFSAYGREYVIVLKDGDQTPAPWINVIANPEFGFQVSESGSSYTWAMNSRENQLTPWTNDPICDPSGEAFYILDRDSSHLWSPTALPIRIPESTYIAYHGQGYSRFEHFFHEIHSELTQFVAWDESIKISRLILENRSASTRKLSVAGYVEWVLGFSRGTMAHTTITEVDPSTGFIFATNVRNSEFGDRVSFSGLITSEVLTKTSFTGDRGEFIGRNGSLTSPLGIFQKEGLSGKVGASADPCAAQQIDLEIEPGKKIELSFILGQARSREHARTLIENFTAQGPQKLLDVVVANWDKILGKVRVETPDEGFNIMVNRWLLYQTLVCRMWARSAFYQAGGAFGFRDQLQDVMALTLTQPNLAREHILRAACRQFVEGDVQHWWHPPTGRGVRTHFSDDLLWLPYVVNHYLKVTGDTSILSLEVPFIEGPLLRPDQEDSYYTPKSSHRAASLFEHCALAIERSLKTGQHGLPLMGSGDWNDGMNRVGKEGKGESVWLAWFLYTNIRQFAPVAQQLGQVERARDWQKFADNLLVAIEKDGWDGDWYRRAYYDDGSPLGSKTNTECQIDSLAQTWAVISQAAKPERQQQAMRALEERLVHKEDQLVLLFTPPFDKTPLDPGYIKGYLPGVRENGGQYTHAASWCVIAYAMMGDGKRAHDLFRLLNPIEHTLNRAQVDRYKVEPYVLAGDVYSQAPHTGRGGWSWYTGSSGWMYRAGLEFILGFSVSGDQLTVKPQIPPDWDSFTIRYRHGNSDYTIEVKAAEQSIDDDKPIHLVDDGKSHVVSIVRGRTLGSP